MVLHKFLSLFNRKSDTEIEVAREQDLVEEDTTSGRIIIEFDSSSGNFTVRSEIYDISSESSTVFSMLLFHIIQGKLGDPVLNSIKLWAGEESIDVSIEEKEEFSNAIANNLFKFDEMLKEEIYKAEKEDFGKGVAVRASNVFRPKGI